MSTEDKKWLYGRLGLDLNYDEFEETLSNDDDMQWYYDRARNMGLEVGTYDEFNELFGNPVQVQPTDSTYKVSRGRFGALVDEETPEEKAERKAIRRIKTADKIAKIGQFMSPVSSPSTFAPTPIVKESEPKLPTPEQIAAAEDERLFKQHLKDSGQMQELYDLRHYARENDGSNGIWDYINPLGEKAPIGGAIHLLRSAFSEDYRDKKRAQKRNRLIAEQADKAIDVYEQATGDRNGISSVFNAVADEASRISTWDLGMTDLQNAATLYDLSQKDEGELTAAEKATLDAIGLASSVMSLYGDEVGAGYKIGQGIPATLSFMGSMALNPAAGYGKKLAGDAVKKFGKDYIKRVAKRAAGDILETGAYVGSVALPQVAVNALDRINGSTTYELDDDLNVVYGGQENQETLGNAIWKAFGETFIEGYTERVGDYFDPIIGFAKGVTKGIKAGKLSDFAEALVEVKPTATMQNIRRFKEKTLFNGTLSELMEEELGMIMNAYTVGDYTFDKEEAERTGKTYILDPENQFVTAMSVGMFSAAINGTEMAANHAYKRKVNKVAEKYGKIAERELGAQFSEMIDGVPSLKERIDNADADEKNRIINDIFANPNLSDKQKQAAATYAVYRQYAQTFNAVQANALNHKADEVKEQHAAYEAGYSSALPAFYNIANAFKEAQQAVNDYTERTGDSSVVDAIQLIENNPSEIKNIRDGLTDEQYQLVTNYTNNLERYRGAYQGRSNRAEDYVDDFAYALEPAVVTDAEGNRTITTALLGERSVYVLENNGDLAHIMRPDGSKTLVKASELTNITTSSADEVIDRYRDMYTSEYNAETENAFEHHPKTQAPQVGLQLQSPEGEVVITAINDNMVEIVPAVYKDGQVQPKEGAEPRTITVDDAYAWQDDYYLSMDADQAYANAMAEANNMSAETVENEGTPSEEIEQSVSEEVADSQISETQPTETESVAPVAPAAPQTARERVPKDDKGNPIYEQTDADTAWDAIVEETEGDVEMAQRVAADMLEDKKAALAKLQNGKPKKGATVAEKIANEKAHAAAIAQAQNDVAQWEAIVGTEARRREAAMSEAERYAAEIEQKNISEGLKALGEPQSLEECVLGQLAGGAYKLRWSDKENGTKGFGSHTGLSTEEMKARLSMIDNKNGLTPEEIAHSIVENMDMSFGEVDVMDVTNMVIDAVSTHASRRAMLNGMVESRAELLRQQEIAEQEAKDAWYMEQYHATEEELAAYNEYLAEFAEEIYGEDTDYEQRIATFAEIQLEYDNQGTDADIRSSADQGEGLTSDREGGRSVGEREQLNQREVLGDAAGVAEAEDGRAGGSVSAESDDRQARIDRAVAEYRENVDNSPEAEAAAERDWQEYQRDLAEDAAETVETLENGDVRRTNLNSNGEIATVVIERDGNVISVDTYEDGALFEHTDYDANGNATKVTRYKDGEVVSEQEYKDGKRKVTANYFEMAEEEQKKRKYKNKKDDTTRRGIQESPAEADRVSGEIFGGESLGEGGSVSSRGDGGILEEGAGKQKRTAKARRKSDNRQEANDGKAERLSRGISPVQSVIDDVRRTPLSELEYVKRETDRLFNEREDQSLSRKEWELTDEGVDAENAAFDSYPSYIQSLSDSGELQRMFDSASVGEETQIRRAVEAAGFELDDVVDTSVKRANAKAARDKKRAEKAKKLIESVTTNKEKQNGAEETIPEGGPRGRGSEKQSANQGNIRQGKGVIGRQIEEFEQRTGWTRGLSDTERIILEDVRKLTDSRIDTLRGEAVESIERGEDVEEAEIVLGLLDKYGRSGERLYLLSQSGIIPNQPVLLDKLEQLFMEYNEDEGLAILFDRLRPIIEQVNPKITFEVIRDVDGNVKDSTVGDFYLKDNHLRFNLHSLNSSFQTDQEKANTIVHEMLHAVTQYALDAKQRVNNGEELGVELSNQLLDAAQSLINIYNAVKGTPILADEYGIKDVHEMVSELANPEFRDKLKQIEVKGKSAWERIKDAIKRFLNRFGDIYDTSAYSKAMIALDELMDNFDIKAYERSRALGSEEKESRVDNLRFRDGAPFFSNAERAVENIKQNKATPEQWLAMIKKDGGLKAGEDKWMGLSDWLNEQKTLGVKSMTKDEVLQFIRENQIEIEEVEYKEEASKRYIQLQDEFSSIVENIESEYSAAESKMKQFDEEMHDKYGDGFYYMLNEKERNTQEKLKNALSRGENPRLFAYEDMISTYGDDFKAALEVDYRGRLVPTSGYNGVMSDEARHYLGINPINSIRLDYTTAGLENKREIALVVPTIKPWNQDDEIHFGDAEVNIVDVPRHNFTGTGREAISKAKEWANRELVGEHVANEGTKEEFKYSIDEKSVKKFLSGVSTSLSDNLGVHLSVLKKLPSVIDSSIEAEIHADYKKGEQRDANNGIEDENLLIHRLYGCARIDGELYRVKTTIKERKSAGVKPYTYEVTKIELLDGSSQEGTSSSDASSNSISGAKLLKGVEKSYDKGKLLLDESKKMSENSINSDEIIAEVERESAALGVPVRIARSVDELPDADTRKRAVGGKLKGYYDPRTGEVVLYAPNTDDANDAKRTILHEIVGHNGLRQLIGEQRYDKAMVQLMYMLPSEVRDAVLRRAERHGWNAAIAMDEYLADQAERDVQPTWWGKVNAMIRALLRNMGFNVMLTDADVTYLLWRSRKKLQGDTAFDMATDAILKQAARKSAEADAWNEQAFKDMEMRDFERNALPSIRHRMGADTNDYEKTVRTLGFKQSEAWQDSMRSLLVFQQALAKASGKDISDFENAYMYENRMSSANLMEMEQYRHMVYNTLLKEIRELEQMGASRESIINYLFAKSGLERNEVFARRDAKKHAEGDATKEQQLYDKYRQKDYAGLTALTRGDAQISALVDDHSKKKTKHDRLEQNKKRGVAVSDADLKAAKIKMDDARKAMITAIEAEAQRMVDEFERAHNTDNLWDKIRNCTHTTLNISHDAGVMSDEVYNELWNQFQYYIPLRGFAETTAEDVYLYLGGNDSPYNAPIKTAYGRTSLADDPIATIGNMAESAIVEANRNRLKQRFLYMVERHNTDLASISDVWLEYDEVNDEWHTVFAQIPDDATPSEAKRLQQEFEDRMKLLSEQNPGKYANASQQPNIPYRVVKKGDRQEHHVIVKRNGKDVVITINGNPRVAQAINGLTNPEQNQGMITRITSWINRNLSANFTMRNPAFMVSNFVRDGFYTNSMVWVKENPAYARQYNKNWAICTAQIASLVSRYKRYEKGDTTALDMNNDMDRMFYEFMINGGETGYTVIKSVEDYKGLISGEMKKMEAGAMGTARRVAGKIGDVVDTFGRWAEDTSRFAAYMTSRQLGRTVTKSIWDAKEISVNFNKKGSGNRMMGKFEQGNRLNYLLSNMSQLGRNLYVFWNASVQGFNNFKKAAKDSPAKFTAMAGTYFTLGVIVAAAFSGDDDEDDYYNLPEYVRRNNICFKIGKGKYATLPLPIEIRAIYGLGELAYSYLSGREGLTHGEAVTKIIQQITQVLPIDMMADGGGAMALVPSAAKPVVEVIHNVDWTGRPIYKEKTSWNQNDPTWTLAFKSTSPELVQMSRLVNEWTNKNTADRLERPYNRGWADNRYLNNPAVWEHIMEGYLGGMATMFNQTKKTLMMPFNEDLREVRNVPIVSRFVKDAGKEGRSYAARNEYYEAKDIMDSWKNEMSKAKKEVLDDSLTDEQRLKAAKLRSSLEQQYMEAAERWKVLDRQRKALEEAYKSDQSEDNRQALDDVMMQMATLVEAYRD